MYTLIELESIQKSFNLLVEHCRSVMKKLYDDAKATKKNPISYGSEHEFYVPEFPGLASRFRDLLKLINPNISAEQLNDNFLGSTIWGYLRTQTTHQTHNDKEGFDESRFIFNLDAALHQYCRSGSLYLSYTGCQPELNQVFVDAPFLTALPAKEHGVHRKNLRLNHPKFELLLNKIDLLRLSGFNKKSDVIFDIADKLYKTIETYLTHPAESEANNFQEISDKIQFLVRSNKKKLKNDRIALEILEHILLVVTEQADKIVCNPQNLSINNNAIFYQSISKRIQREQEYKTQWIYKNFGHALVTRFFPTGEKYPVNTNCNPQAPSPTMFTPWNKILGPNGCSEQKIPSQASFFRTVKSITAQFLYDTMCAIFYTIAAIPSLITGLYYLGYASLLEKNQKMKNGQVQFAREICFGNVILAPYFAISIVVDFLREFCALFSRSLATMMQADEERAMSYWPESRNIKFC